MRIDSPVKRPAGRPAVTNPQDLLDVAETLFAEQGCERVPTRELAKRAGCNIAMISYHFGGKRGLYQAVIERHSKRIHDLFENAHSGEDAEKWPELREPEQRQLCTLLFGAARVIILDNRMHKIICREQMTGEKNMLPLLMKADSSLLSPIRKYLRNLITTGKLNPKLNWRYTLVSLIGPLVYSGIAGPVLRDVYDLQKIDEGYIRQLCIHLTRGLFDGQKGQ